METFYKKVIYDICQLIKQKSFKRAVILYLTKIQLS